MKLIDNVGCDSTLTMPGYLKVQKAPTPNFDADTLSSVCYPLIVQFTDLSVHPNLDSWIWNFGFVQAESHLQNPIYTYTVPGNFNVSLTAVSSFGCAASITKSSFINVGGPFAEYNIPDTVCANSQVLFNSVNEKNVFSKKWYFGDGYSFEGDSVYHSFNFKGSVFPSLFLTVDAIHSCDKFFIDTLYIQKPEAKMMTDVGFQGCIPFNVSFFDQSVNTINQAWNLGNGTVSNDKNPQTVYYNPGTFNAELIVTDSKSCKDTLNKQITAFPYPDLKICADTFICRGETVKLSISGAENYVWKPNLYLDDANSSNPNAKPDSSLTYYVTATDSNSCVNYSLTRIKIQQHPKVNLRDTTVIVGETVKFNAFSSEIASYLWSFPTSVSCAECSETSVIATDSMTIELLYTDTVGCFLDKASANINVRFEYTIDVPTAFSPNNDGVNDILNVRGWGVKELIEFKIFNRFGEMVFNSTDLNQGWDGFYKGNLQNIETYIYTVSVKTFENQIISKKGSVKLLK